MFGNNLIDLNTFFEIAGKENVETFRFSIGNPIEIPLFVTSLLYASIKLLPPSQTHLTSATINFAVTLISQSRIMVIIALLIVVRELMKSNFKIKVFALTILVISLPYLATLFGEEFLSYIDRLSGNDAGSADDRAFLFQIFFNNLNLVNIFTGNGITSSLDLIKQYTGDYRTIESVLVQLLYEIGIIGSTIFAINVFFDKKKVYIPIFWDFIVFLTFIQMFLFLPIFTLMPFVFFMFGVCTKPYELDFKKKITVQHEISN
jgi:hypothetical protein